MKRYSRLMLITLLGIGGMCLSTWSLYGIRNALGAHGYVVSQGVFLISFFVTTGGIFSVAVSLAMREVKRLNADNSAS